MIDDARRRAELDQCEDLLRAAPWKTIQGGFDLRAFAVVMADAVAAARREEREAWRLLFSGMHDRFHSDSGWDCDERCEYAAALRAGGPTEEMT